MKGKITHYQLLFMLVILINGAYALLIPSTLGRVVGANGIWIIPAAGLVGLALMALYCHIAKIKGDRDFRAFFEQLYGKILGKAATVFLGLYFFYATALCLKIFMEMLSAELLPNTPQAVLMLATLVPIYWIVSNGLEDIARLSALLAGLLIVMLLTVLAGNIRDMSLINILPFITQPWGEYWRGIAVVLPVFLLGAVVLGIYPHIIHQEKILRTTMAAVVLGVLYLTANCASVVAVFGVTEGTKIAWPVIELARMVRIGPFLERVEALFIAVWLCIIFINGSVLAWSSWEVWRQLFRKKGGRWLRAALFALLWLSVWGYNDMVGIFKLLYFTTHYVLPAAGGFLLLTALLATIRRPKEADNEKQ